MPVSPKPALCHCLYKGQEQDWTSFGSDILVMPQEKEENCSVWGISLWLMGLDIYEAVCGSDFFFFFAPKNILKGSKTKVTKWQMWQNQSETHSSVVSLGMPLGRERSPRLLQRTTVSEHVQGSGQRGTDGKQTFSSTPGKKTGR